MRSLSLYHRIELGFVLAALAGSGVVFSYSHLSGANHQSVLDWVFTSWATLLALSAGLHLLEIGPLASAPPLLLRVSALVRYFLLLVSFIVLAPRLGIPKGPTRGLILILAVSFWLFAMLKLFWPNSAPSFPLLSLFSLFGGRGSSSSPSLPPGTSSLSDGLQTKMPSLKFRDVGGKEAAKEQIRRLVETRLQAGKFAKQGIVQNGVLLYGPQGTGKTLLAEATAGEFGLRYLYVSATALNGMWVGETEQNIRNIFSTAASGRTLLFLDEIDALGSARQTLNSQTSLASNRMFNNTTIQLMQCVDQYRKTPGLVLMAATNALDSLDPALIREGRFDLKVRLDLPDEATRAQILVTLLAKKGAHFPVARWARATSGASPAKLQALVDRAHALALEDKRGLREEDLAAAFEVTGGQDRPLIQPVQWDELIVEPRVEEELRLLVRQLKGSLQATSPLPVPTGVLLAGPPGTGKTMIARLLATQTKRSFYPVTAADLLGSGQGDSVKKLAELFARAKEQSPSIIFFDELDGLFGSSHGFASSHDKQFTEQALIEISRIEPANNVLLVGATNHADRLDPRILRGGRFSEKIEIGVPGLANRQRLLGRLLERVAVAVPLEQLAADTEGLAPADIEAVVQAAKRFAFGRSDRDDQLPPLIAPDFERAIERVHPVRYAKPASRAASVSFL